MWSTCSGGDAAGVTAGGACTVAVVDGVVTAGATAGATGTAAGNFDLLRLAARTNEADVSFGSLADICSAKSDVRLPPIAQADKKAGRGRPVATPPARASRIRRIPMSLCSLKSLPPGLFAR